MAWPARSTRGSDFKHNRKAHMELTLKDLTELLHGPRGEPLVASEISSIATYPDLIGAAFFFRTVTYHLVGRVEEQTGSFVRLADAAWIADSGRFTQAIADGTLNEVEPVGTAWVNLDSVTDFYPWNHALP